MARRMAEAGVVLIMDSEFYTLTAEQQDAVQQAVAFVRNHGKRKSVSTPDGGEAYAYPHPSGGVSWGFNRPGDGFNIARGVEF